MADILVFDCLGQVFYNASAFLFLQRNFHLPHIYLAQHLAHSSFSLSFSLCDLEKQEIELTKIVGAKVCVPLSRINQWFSTTYKISDISIILAATVSSN